MSSSTEQESRTDSKVAKALEVVKNPFFREIGIRIDSPSQVPKVGETLKFTEREEEDTKALVWLKKNEPNRYEAVMKASEANTEKRRKKMKRRKMKRDQNYYEEQAEKEVNKIFQWMNDEIRKAVAIKHPEWIEQLEVEPVKVDQHKYRLYVRRDLDTMTVHLLIDPFTIRTIKKVWPPIKIFASYDSRNIRDLAKFLAKAYTEKTGRGASVHDAGVPQV